MSDHIVFCGKGGVGSSTVTTHVGAALADVGFTVLQIGSGYVPDGFASTNNESVCRLIRRGEKPTVDSVVRRGVRRLSILELGSPPGFGEEGAGELDGAIQAIIEAGIIPEISPDLVLYDVSGEHGRALLHALRRHLRALTVFVVTTADLGALVGANNLLTTLTTPFPEFAAVALGGLIPNNAGNVFDESFIRDFAGAASLHLLPAIPRSLQVRQAELFGKTVIEAAPHSTHSYFYRRLANQVVDAMGEPSLNRDAKPLSREQLREWSTTWGERLHALENGLVTDGEAI